MNKDNLNWDDLLVQYGLGAFETMFCDKGQIPLLPFHIKRITSIAKYWDISKTDLKNKIDESLVKLPTRKSKIKLIIGLDSSEGLKSHLYISPYSEGLKEKHLLYKKGEGLKNEFYKSCNYAQHYLAKKQASKMGLDDVCYGYKNKITECSTSALVVLNKQRGWVATGPNLESVSANKLLANTDKYWVKADINLKKMKDEDMLCTVNALYGLVPVKTIFDTNKVLLYTQKKHHDLTQWNHYLFNHE